MANRGAAYGDAPDTLERALETTLPVAEATLRDETRLTGLWGHDEAHGHLPAMKSHVIITYYGDVQDMVWRQGKERFAGLSSPGALTIIPEGHDGHWDIFGPIRVSNLFLPHQRLMACADELNGGRAVELLGRVGFEDPAATQILQLLARNPNAASEPSARLFVEHATDLLVAHLVRSHSSFGAIRPPDRAGLAGWQVRRVTDYMQAHIDEPLGLDALAAVVGLSRFHFCTAFRKATGQTPHAWLVNLRIERARQLLARAELPVTQIAFAVGYESSSSFAAAFRRLTGSTPREFRRSL